MQASWLSNVELSRFDEFLKVLWAAARRDDDTLPDSPPDGIGELAAAPWPVGYALDRATRFFALQWQAGEDQGLPGLRYEAFFLCPASAAPQAGLRVLAPVGTVPVETSAATFGPPAWWSGTLGLAAAPPARILPGFLELVALLAANGDVATTSAEAQSAFSELANEVAYYRQLSGDLAEDLRLLQAKVRDLRARPTAPAMDLPESEEAPEPVKDLSGLASWALKNAERITLLPRALYGAKKSLYENPAAVYTALELLAGPYRDHRLGLLDKEGFNNALASAGVQLAGSVGASTAGSYGDAYFVPWKNRKVFLDFHLVKGASREERFCMRIYFFWDDESSQVVVGWLPSHLRNSLT